MSERAGEKAASGPKADRARNGDAADPTGVPSAGPAPAVERAERQSTAVTARLASPGAPEEGAPGAGATDVISNRPDGTSVDEQAQRAPADWANFAPRPIRPPGRVHRAWSRTSAVRRFTRHEWTLAVVGALVLSLLLNRGALADPAHTLPQDVWDPSLVAYLIAWGGHALVHDPTNIWHLNGFYPSPLGLAYTDSLLGYAPLAVVGTGPEAAVLRYNVIFILAQALVLFGGYALARQLGLGRTGALVSAIAVAVAPWRLAQAGHLQVLSTGGIALALAMLA
ncbi:MAG TPA: hypothetical protein VF163_19370, partial [Micromonosporaceae bacterium]